MFTYSSGDLRVSSSPVLPPQATVVAESPIRSMEDTRHVVDYFAAFPTSESRDASAEAHSRAGFISSAPTVVYVV